jgi:hypothetical protein
MVTRSPGEPGFDLRRFVRGVVVDDEMDGELFGNTGIDVSQQGQKLRKQKLRKQWDGLLLEW